MELKLYQYNGPGKAALRWFFY